MRTTLRVAFAAITIAFLYTVAYGNDLTFGIAENIGWDNRFASALLFASLLIGWCAVSFNTMLVKQQSQLSFSTRLAPQQDAKCLTKFLYTR